MQQNEGFSGGRLFLQEVAIEEVRKLRGIVSLAPHLSKTNWDVRCFGFCQVLTRSQLQNTPLVLPRLLDLGKSQQ